MFLLDRGEAAPRTPSVSKSGAPAACARSSAARAAARTRRR